MVPIVKKSGMLTQHGFALGYVEWYKHGKHTELCVSYDMGCFWVKGFIKGIHIMQSFKGMGDARYYAKSCTSF